MGRDTCRARGLKVTAGITRILTAKAPDSALVPIYTIRGSCGQGAMNAVARRLDDAPAEARHGRNRAMGELARPDHAGMRTFVVLMTPSNELVSEHP